MQAIGIQLDGSTFRWALVKWDGRRIRSLELQTEALPKVKQLYNKQKSVPLVSGLSAGDLVIRALPFNSAPSRKLMDALILQTQTQLHLKPEEMLTLAAWPAKGHRTTTIYTTTLSSLDAHLEMQKPLRIDPERVGSLPAAFLAFIKWKAPNLKSYFLIYVGQNSSSVLWVENGVVQNAHDIDFGLFSLKTAFQEDRKKLISLKERDEIDFSALKSGQYPNLAEEARRFRRDLSKILCSFNCQKPLLFMGEIDPSGPFRDFLWETLRDFAAEEIRLELTPEERASAGCCGLAIDYLIQRKSPLQFRRKERTAPFIWQKLGRLSLSLLAASFFFSSAFYTIGSWWLREREREVVQSLERWAATKDSALRFELFSAGDKMENLVNQWLRIIEKNRKEYPFLMKAPRVALFLDWLSNHPLIVSFRQNGDPISFEQIHYQLESFPHLEALREPYLAKIELEFKLANPLHARQMHEAFLQDETLVDTSRDISWDVLPDSYRTSFYLKSVSHGNF